MKFDSKPIAFEGISAFKIHVDYNEIDESPDFKHIGPHIHNECEIYINISGDVSFMVEKNIYPIKRGNVIITNPYEYHHCVYHSKAMHKYFCIWIDSEDNQKILSNFFDRNPGEGNHIILSEENAEKLINICFEFWKTLSSLNRRYYLYFELLELLAQGTSAENEDIRLPSDIKLALDYIENNYLGELNITDIAKYAHTSINTLERHFKETLRTTPLAYINKKRLSHSVILLKKGCSVMEAAEKSGFSDYSGYIAKFKKIFGMTPLKYQKLHK